MNMRHGILLLALLSSLSACASSYVQAGMNRLGGKATTAAVVPAKGAESLWVTLPSRGVKFPMSKLGSDGTVTVFAAKDGSQIALREGILINTRGFGRDLMSAEAPSLAVLTRPGDHRRIYFDLDGSDTMRRHEFSCTSEFGPTEGTPFARHVIEKCLADIGTIQNEFWLDSRGRIQTSQQWVSEGVGYAAVEPKVDG